MQPLLHTARHACNPLHAEPLPAPPLPASAQPRIGPRFNHSLLNTSFLALRNLTVPPLSSASPSLADMTQICAWLFAKPSAALPPATSVPAAAPAASSEASRGGAPPPGALLGVPPPPLPADTFEGLGLLPDSGTDSFMDLLSDGELDLLIADLAGACNDAGHLLPASNPRLP